MADKNTFAHNMQKEMPTKRPKLLFLARPFPPLRSAASVRTWNIAKYLARLDWDITVVTPQSSIWRFVENPEETNARVEQEGIRRILTGHQWRCLEPDHLHGSNGGLGWLTGGACRKIARSLGIDSAIGWIRASEQACSALQANDVDVILATGPPFAPFRLAKRLSDRLGCPYVLDYRDPWTSNPHATRPPRSAVIQEEARLLEGCAAVTIVSPSWGRSMENRFDLTPKLHVVTNGYSSEELAAIEPHDFGHFAIVYTGNFYPPKRVISPLLAALKRLKETMPDKEGMWFFHYYGKHESHVREEARRFGVLAQVVLHGYIQRSEALSAARGASIVVVITSIAGEGTQEEKGIVPAKVFEALGLKTPTLLIAPPGSDAEAIMKTTGLARVFAGNDIDGMASFLAEAIRGWTPERRNSQEYAWPNIAKKLDSILRQAMSRR